MTYKIMTQNYDLLWRKIYDAKSNLNFQKKIALTMRISLKIFENEYLTSRGETSRAGSSSRLGSTSSRAEPSRILPARSAHRAEPDKLARLDVPSRAEPDRAGSVRLDKIKNR